MPIACLVGKTLTILPESGAVTSPVAGMTAKPSPIIFCEKTGSFTSVKSITSPVATVNNSFSIPKTCFSSFFSFLFVASTVGSGISAPDCSKSSISDFNTSAFGPYTACTPLSLTIKPIAPARFHSSSEPTFPGSSTLTRKRVIQASTSLMFSFPPNKWMILMIC